MNLANNTKDQEIDIDSKKKLAAAWFTELRDSICKAFEYIEDELSGTAFSNQPAGRFERKLWGHKKQIKRIFPAVYLTAAVK